MWKQRLQDPFLWLGISALAYQGLNQAGIVVPQETWDLGLDVLSYAVIGVGVVSGYKGRE